ncbi:hypothetical protein SNE40_015324 [Patella caerulea]|uniref:Uncharacterized protein n=1 Tax=Patella caerulea TaxID=87958 RepID=A0AAN8JH31_PATCE
MLVFTTTPYNLPPVCTTSSSFNSINSSVLNLNAAQLLHHPGMGHTTQPSLSLMSNILPQQPVDMSVSRHVPDKIKQDIWANKYIDFSVLLPGGNVPTQLAINIAES